MTRGRFISLLWYYKTVKDCRVVPVWQRDFHYETACYHHEL